MDQPYQLPLITPSSKWKRPAELPDLRGRPLVALDTEECDHGLSSSRGPGWATGNGYVLGVSWATADGNMGYAPIAHPDTECFDKDQVARWLRDLVRSKTRLVFQNAPYDLGWMHADLGVDVPPEYPIEDTLCASFMINENEYEYNLGAVCERLGLPGKDETLLREAASAYLRPANAKKSWKLTGKEVKAGMYRLPARYAGPYAETDAVRTLQAIQKMLPVLDEQDVADAYRLEMDIVPIIRRMRTRGIKLDIPRVLMHRRDFEAKRAAILAELTRRLPGRASGGVTMEHLRSTKWLDPIFGDERIGVPRTEKDHASYKQDWMEAHPHWLPKLVAKALQYDRFVETFLKEYILGFAHKGRIHAEVHQYKSDDGGTVSYRFAYSNPPLQQAPSADIDPEFGNAFRECFVADAIWGANDYSQQEYRLTAHFAALCRVRGGDTAVRQFAEDPDLDFHQMVANLTKLPRSKAKIQNFALLYGQGLDATASKLGVSVDEAKEMRAQVERSAPFGPALDEYAKRRAQDKGFLKLLDGARVRFDEFEAGWLDKAEWERAREEKWAMEPCDWPTALERKENPQHPWHNTRLRRAGVRKALNRLIQGSAARQTKLAIRECGRAGLIPILQMHDELGHDEDDPSKIWQVAEIMRTVIPLLLPMKVDTGLGKSWAEAKSKDAKQKAETEKVVPGVQHSDDPTRKDATHISSRLGKLINAKR